MATPPATFSDRTNGAFTLAPQTTPFSPSATAAAACSSRSVLCFTPAGKLRKSYACDLVDRINSESYKYLNLDCYPNRFDVINNGEPYSEQTVAYPGTACPLGFTPACATTLTLSNPSATPTPYTGTLAQTWCCPDGDWVCTNRDSLEPTSRYCLSVVANTAQMWFGSAAGATTAANAGPKYTTSGVAADMSVRVLRKALPLGEYKRDVLRGLAGDAAVLTAANASTSTGGSSGTGPASIAGITVGALALVTLIAVEPRGSELGAESESGTRIRGGGFAASPQGTFRSEDLNTEVSSATVDSPMFMRNVKEWRTQPVEYHEMGDGQAAAEMATGYNKSVVD
ncbi:hypothetical protein QBC34DRAFT_498762 [Podospora aff. communis PSN243]|uniref:Uncharacterized protein n=1 Tax=Podospora aff. communis PSN243 TaxID=3040156 RepID=A0AAV9G6S4_9PEZI|nr:hypothetical protein QBC34DRAFT_498762 [Podospora aff. communis PSN243]